MIIFLFICPHLLKNLVKRIESIANIKRFDYCGVRMNLVKRIERIVYVTAGGAVSAGNLVKRIERVFENVRLQEIYLCRNLVKRIERSRARRSGLISTCM